MGYNTEKKTRLKLEGADEGPKKVLEVLVPSMTSSSFLDVLVTSGSYCLSRCTLSWYSALL